jgi:hypothetical protein
MNSLTDGPFFTDMNGELETAILTCHHGNNQCKHFGIHNGHYFYCSAQDAENQHKNALEYYYPWEKAGKQMHDKYPSKECPYINETLKEKL